MKKMILAVSLSFLTLSALFAYNPPVFADSMYELSSPKTLSLGSSVSGGAIFSGSPDSIISNPAISAQEQRAILNFGYTGLVSTNNENPVKYGSAFQISTLIPFKIFVLNAYLNGTFIPFEEMNLNNSFTLKTAISKPITEKLDLGLGINSGIAWGKGKSWLISANLGGLYHYGDLAFMKDFRIGASILNLGNNFNSVNGIGINGNVSGGYPSIFTVKVGAAASLFKNDLINLGCALDLTTPTFQNLILDAALQFSVKEMLFINLSEKLNIREIANGYKDFIPAVSLNFKFTFDFNNNYMTEKGWEQSEFNAFVGYKQIVPSVNAVSASADLILGLKDTTPPVIEIWMDDEE